MGYHSCGIFILRSIFDATKEDKMAFNISPGRNIIKPVFKAVEKGIVSPNKLLSIRYIYGTPNKYITKVPVRVANNTRLKFILLLLFVIFPTI